MERCLGTGTTLLLAGVLVTERDKIVPVCLPTSVLHSSVWSTCINSRIAGWILTTLNVAEVYEKCYHISVLVTIVKQYRVLHLKTYENLSAEVAGWGILTQGLPCYSQWWNSGERWGIITLCVHFIILLFINVMLRSNNFKCCQQ